MYQVCPNDETSMTLTFLLYGQIFVLVAVAILEELLHDIAGMQ